MNDRIEALMELPLKAKLGIFAGMVTLIVGAYYFLFFADLQTQISENRESISQLKLQIAEKQGIAANLPKYEKEVEKLEAELQKALAELPDRKELDLLLSRISDKARDAGLDIRLFEPQNEQLKDFYAAVPVSIEVHGNYHQVASFFDEVGKLERIVNMDQFELSKPKMNDGEILLATSVTATSFRFLDESERPKEDKKKRKKRRKRRTAE